MPHKPRPVPTADQLRTRLRALIDADPRSHGEIAEAAGMKPAHLSQVLTGHRANPSFETVGRILDVLGRNFSDLEQEKI